MNYFVKLFLLFFDLAAHGMVVDIGWCGCQAWHLVEGLEVKSSLEAGWEYRISI